MASELHENIINIINLLGNTKETKVLSEVATFMVNKAFDEYKGLYSDKPNTAMPNTKPHQNPVNRLQEITQKAKLPMPIYEFKYVDKDWHCIVNAKGFETKASGSTKAEAKKKAAEEMILSFCTEL